MAKSDTTIPQVNGQTSLYGIIGNPVRHSFSPAMQTLAFQYLKLNAVYLPFPISENDLPRLFDAFRLVGVQGFNVTVPYKEKIVPYLTELSDEAAFLGAVNTVQRVSDGWKGYNTDVSGFIRSLEVNQIELRNRKVLLIGAGGAAKGIAFGLIKAGISSLTIRNRTESKAVALKNTVQMLNDRLTVRVNQPEIDHFDLLINTTSVGMEGEQLPVTEELIQSSDSVVDIIYNPPMTPLLKYAQAAGIHYLNGIDMLLFQGADAFEIWTKTPAPVDIMKESLKNSLAFIS